MTKKSDAPAIRFKGFSDAWEQRLLGQSHYVNGGHKNGMNTRLLGILLHIILHISTFNHSS